MQFFLRSSKFQPAAFYHERKLYASSNVRSNCLLLELNVHFKKVEPRHHSSYRHNLRSIKTDSVGTILATTIPLPFVRVWYVSIYSRYLSFQVIILMHESNVVLHEPHSPPDKAERIGVIKLVWQYDGPLNGTYDAISRDRQRVTLFSLTRNMGVSMQKFPARYQKCNIFC